MSVTFRVALQGQTVPLRFQTVNFAGIRELVEADVTAAINARAAKAANGSDFATPLNGASGSGLVGFQQAGTGAVTRTAQTVLRERPVSVLDYYDAGDGSDYGPAFGRALDASSRVFWPERAGGYEVSSTLDKTLTADTIIDWNGQEIMFSAVTTLRTTKIADSGVALVGNPARYATSVTISGGASASVQAGDIINLQSSVVPFSDAADTKQDTVRIRTAAAGVLTLDAGLNFPWAAAESGLIITVYRPVKITHIRPNFLVEQTDGETATKSAIVEVGFRDVEYQSPVFRGALPFTPSANIYRVPVQFYYCVGYLITGATYENVSYPFGVYGGSRNGIELGSRSRNCRHSHADVGGFGSDYRLSGLHDEDSFIALSTHPAFRCHADGFEVRNGAALTAFRCMGGSLKNGLVHTTDASSDTPQIQSWTPNSGFDYLFDDADFDLDGVTFDNPNRTAPDVFIHRGRNVRIENTQAIDVRVGATVDHALFGIGNRFSGGKASPRASLVLSPARVDGLAILDGYLDTGVYHIDPHRSIVAQSNKRLTCSGQVFRKQAQGTYAVRVHVNGVAGISPVYLQGEMCLTAIVQHESAGFYSQIKHLYTFGLALGGGGFITMGTTPIQVIGPATGSGGTNISLAMSNVAYTDGGTGGDSYISFDVAIATLAGVSSSSVGLEYDLTLRETFAA